MAKGERKLAKLKTVKYTLRVFSTDNPDEHDIVEVEGKAFGKYFAIRKEKDNFYSVDHIPSGLSIRAHIRTGKFAIRIAEQCDIFSRNSMYIDSSVPSDVILAFPPDFGAYLKAQTRPCAFRTYLSWGKLTKGAGKKPKGK